MEITVRPVVRPLQLYPPLEMSILEFCFSSFPSDRFSLWLPEMIRTRGHGEWMYNQAREGPQLWRAGSSARRWSCHTLTSDLLSVDASVRVGTGCAHLRFELENRSPAALEEIVLASCYQLVRAPHFRDQEGVNTYAWRNDELVNIALHGVPPTTHDHHDVVGSSFLCLADADRGFGLIGVESPLGGATAMAWTTRVDYYGNTDPSLCCLHADPVCARLAAGESTVLRGWLGWFEGSIARLSELAREALARE